MNSEILEEFLVTYSRAKGEPVPAAIKIIVSYVAGLEDQVDKLKQGMDEVLR